MSIIDYLLLAVIGAGLYFALRHMKKNKGGCCGGGGCCGDCRNCNSTTCGKREE